MAVIQHAKSAVELVATSTSRLGMPLCFLVCLCTLVTFSGFCRLDGRVKNALVHSSTRIVSQKSVLSRPARSFAPTTRFPSLWSAGCVARSYIEQSDDSVHVTLYSIAVLSLCALLVGVIAAAATHVAMKQKSVQMLERAKAPWQSYGSRDEEGAPLIAKRPSLSFSV